MGLIVLENEHGSATVSSHAGATLRSLRANVSGRWHELLSGGLAEDLGENVTPSGVGSFIMAPWANRIHRGRLVFKNSEYQLPVDSGEHAIHGTVRRREWEIVSETNNAAELRIELQNPWPFSGHVVSKIELEGFSLRQTLEVHADGEELSFPAGVGWHPWFRRSLGSRELNVKVDVVGQWELDENVIPSGEMSESSASEKLRAGGWFDIGEVDDCFQLGSSRLAELWWPELRLRIQSSPEVRQVMVYSPADSICVEPQTTTVNAFQLADRGIEDTGTCIVSTGKPLTATTVWSWHAS